MQESMSAMATSQHAEIGEDLVIRQNVHVMPTYRKKAYIPSKQVSLSFYL